MKTKVKSTKGAFRMGSPEYHIAMTIEIMRVGGGWDEHELAWPVEKRCVGFTIPKGQITNFQAIGQMAGQVASVGACDGAVAEGIRIGKLQKAQPSPLSLGVTA